MKELLNCEWEKKNIENGCVIWLTGLSGSGKTTIADKLANFLEEEYNELVEILDGDNVRQHLTNDLGFSKEDRDKNIERVSFLAKLLSRNGVIVICSFISPYQKQRDNVRSMTTNFLEVYIKCPLDVCEKRDVKGLYKKARAGIIKEFTGISDPYEEPLNPEIIVETDKNDVDYCVKQIINKLSLMF